MNKIDKKLQNKIEREEYQKNMKQIDLSQRFVFIQNYNGFGNKIFDLILCLYLKKKYKYDIYYVDGGTLHKNSKELRLNDIFPELKKEINFISNQEGDYIQYTFYYKKSKIPWIKNIDEIDTYFIYDKMFIRSCSLYYLVFDFFDTFTEHEIKLFTINKTLLQKNTSNLINGKLFRNNSTIMPIILSNNSTTNYKYAAIHIRYADKLDISISEIKKKIISFPMNTPQFYYEQIQKIQKENIPIFILTDSIDIVKEFIIKKYKLDTFNNIHLLSIHYIDSFYLLMNSSYFVMSHSTFSFTAYLLGKKYNKSIKKKIIFCTIPEFEDKYKTTNIIDWTVINNKKYILNFDKKLMTKMHSFYSKQKNIVI